MGFDQWKLIWLFSYLGFGRRNNDSMMLDFCFSPLMGMHMLAQPYMRA